MSADPVATFELSEALCFIGRMNWHCTGHSEHAELEADKSCDSVAEFSRLRDANPARNSIVFISSLRNAVFKTQSLQDTLLRTSFSSAHPFHASKCNDDVELPDSREHSIRYLSQLLRCIPNRLASVIAETHVDARNIVSISRALSRSSMRPKSDPPKAAENDRRYSTGRFIMTTVTQARK